MDQNFQTSFIPKKPMIEQRAVAKRPMGLILIISIFIFLVMVLVSGWAYFYKGMLEKQLAKMESDLDLARNRFEPSQITKLRTLDKRLKNANEVFSKHITVSPVFEALEEITMKTIRYTKFAYDLKDNKIIIKMSGQAIGYRSVALQADLFAKNENLIDPVFSNLSLDEKEGNVLFDLEFSVNTSFLDYKQVLKRESSLSAIN